MHDLDTLGRRNRATPRSTGKRITLQPADRIWLAKLAAHGPLPSSFLLAYTRHLRRSDKRATERLTDLFNEAETRHGGRCLDRPPQQFRTLDSRYNQLVYDLAAPARDALRESSDLPDHIARPSGPWLHRFMVACVTASIELATLARNDLAFIPQHRILARAETDLRCPVRIIDPTTGRTTSKALIPDAVFGLEYRTPGGKRFRFFAVECDRATEPATTSNINRKSWLRNLMQYRDYVGCGRYRDHLRLTAPLLVLTVTTDPTRLERLRTLTEKEAGPDGVAYLLFQLWSAFGPVFRPLVPNRSLLVALWQRAGRVPFRIDQA